MGLKSSNLRACRLKVEVKEDLPRGRNFEPRSHRGLEAGYGRSGLGGTFSIRTSYLPSRLQFLIHLQAICHAQRCKGIAALDQVLMATWSGKLG
jgi:hypothetical protein